MGDTRGFFACAAGAALALSLAGCSGLVGGVGTLPNAQSVGETVGADALAATSAPTQSPTPIDGHFTVNSGWKDTTGCPSGAFEGFTEALGAPGSTVQTTPSTLSGPASFPTLTAKYVPSCAFSYKTTSGVALTAEIFIGMGPAYQTEFESALTAAGYSRLSAQSTTYSVTYELGRSVVGVVYIPANAQGSPYSMVAILGT